jgi:threonylcarbamoyladenosine tRNA methylthiotransferase MtaB
MPDACIGVDVIVGFPGETEEEFLKTYHFLHELPVSYLHVFPYSERANTEAAIMEGSVPQAVRAKRSKMLRTLSVKKRRQFYETQLGKTWPVLFEEENKKGYIHGFSPNYVKLRAPWNPEWAGKILPIQFTEIDEQGLMRGQLLRA